MSLETPSYLVPQVRLVSYTRPVKELEALGVETPMELIAYCARVSNPKNQLNMETATKLIKFLLDRKEWSPLEMIDATFEITTARDIGRQQLRHRTAFFQEFSQRYADVTEDLHCLREARMEHPSDRQSSIPSNNEALNAEWEARQLEVLRVAQETYDWARENRIAKECARVVQPEGLTLTTIYMKNPLRNWIHYIGLRDGNGTQLEHQAIAQAIAHILTDLFPIKDVL